MALHRSHADTRPAPTWARRSLTRARRLEKRVEYHWPFVAYALMSFATGGYVIIQLRGIC
jgi:hypothetical protein